MATCRSTRRIFPTRGTRRRAFRAGDWKIVRTAPDEPWQLFDLSGDVGETNDLAATQPERVRELAERFGGWLDREGK